MCHLDVNNSEGWAWRPWQGLFFLFKKKKICLLGFQGMFIVLCKHVCFFFRLAMHWLQGVFSYPLWVFISAGRLHIPHGACFPKQTLAVQNNINQKNNNKKLKITTKRNIKTTHTHTKAYQNLRTELKQSSWKLEVAFFSTLPPNQLQLGRIKLHIHSQ